MHIIDSFMLTIMVMFVYVSIAGITECDAGSCHVSSCYVVSYQLYIPTIVTCKSIWLNIYVMVQRCDSTSILRALSHKQNMFEETPELTVDSLTEGLRRIKHMFEDSLGMLSLHESILMNWPCTRKSWRKRGASKLTCVWQRMRWAVIITLVVVTLRYRCATAWWRKAT